LALNNFCLFPKIRSALKRWRFQDNEDAQKKNDDDGTESYPTTGVPTKFPTVAASSS
jgi:hypothetical protein